MGIGEQVIYYTPNGNLKSYLTFREDNENSFPSILFQAGKFMSKLGKKAASTSQGRWVVWGKHGLSFFISFCEGVIMTSKKVLLKACKKTQNGGKTFGIQEWGN